MLEFYDVSSSSLSSLEYAVLPAPCIQGFDYLMTLKQGLCFILFSESVALAFA